MPRSARATFAILFAALLPSAREARADADWQPLLTQDGVSVEERNAPGRTLPELRASAEIDAGVFEVLAVISDVPRQKEWMADCEESRLIREEPGDVSLIYNRTGAPWPISDRDVVLRAEAKLLEPSQHAAVSFANVDDPSTPPIDGIVRMPRLAGSYDLVAAGPVRTRVTYQIDIDPGGSLPVFVVTRTTRDTPLHTLLGLRRQVVATRGHYADFVSTWSARR
ncbi:MAG: START domain-containing protein [Myxococcota bacterium]